MNEISLHWPVFLFAAVASVLTGLLFGLIPALKVASPNLRESLHAGSRSVVGKAGQFRVSMLLVVGQIALSVVVITAGGLMLRSLWSLSRVNPGFQTERVVTAQVSLDENACKTVGRCQAFFATLLDHARGLAGVETVALADSLPLKARVGNYVYDAERHPRDARQAALVATKRIVSPSYFAGLGIQLVRGRLLDDQDASGESRAVVISQSMANRLWPHAEPLGMHLLNVIDERQPAVWEDGKAATVVGVVSNTHEGSLASDFGDEVYLPMVLANEQPTMYVLLRTRSSAATAAQELRRTVAAISSQAPVTRVRR